MKTLCAPSAFDCLMTQPIPVDAMLVAGIALLAATGLSCLVAYALAK